MSTNPHHSPIAPPPWAADWPSHAVALANSLRARGHAGQGQGIIAHDAPLPPPLLPALTGVAAGIPDCAWPHWATITGPANWPALIRDHPDAVTVLEADMLDNDGPTWAATCTAYNLLSDAGHTPAIAGMLEVDKHARVTLFPLAITIEHDPDPALRDAVTAALVAGGRPHDAIGTQSNEWCITC